MEQLLEFTNSILKMLLLGTMCFYTTWALILLLLYLLGILKDYQTSIFLVLITIFYVGNIITYINPRVIEIPFIKRKISGTILKLFNLVFHIFPLIIFLIFYDTKIPHDNLYLAVFSLLTYILLFNPIKIYNYRVKSKESMLSSLLVVIYFVFILLLIIKQKNLL